MIQAVVRQIALGLVVVLVAMTVTFLLVRLSGDPTAQLLPEGATLEERQALLQELGLLAPIHEQYLTYLRRAVVGDFGESYFDGDTVSSIILMYLPNTLMLGAVALIVAVTLGVPLGVMAAVRQGGALDRAIQFVSVLGASTPAFWMALLLMQIFAVSLNWFPTYGMGGWEHLVLPAATLAIANFPRLARLTRSAMLEVLPAGFILASRAKGMPERRVIWRVLLRNGCIPVLALVALEIGGLFGGAVLTETVFSWPGIGQLAIRSLQRRDYPVIQGIVAYVAVMFAIVTVVGEVAMRAADPRLRKR
ncbi:ABC transporter permease [Roseomonas fluvialis]|uniref:Peptide ABC transporter permease n=1 Tax=Roseomonas fluvialis TaxID=1750527 RepID=A0ABN6P280_9PROT|nr:ABC transporter permease [Roseomonas fluvialis]BDG71719.1 peptide ABC transporter permease [Roseomonas fluvialis]